MCYSLRQALPPAVFYKKAAAINTSYLNCHDQTPIHTLCLHIERAYQTDPFWERKTHPVALQLV